MSRTVVSKGWGYELWIVNKPEYCGKLLFFNKGKRCSLHYHEIKDETFYLQSGRLVIYGDFPAPVYMEPGDSLHIAPGTQHQIVALEDSELFEFSTEHFDHDSYRVIKGD